jgi:hypothetical protein
MRFARSSFLTLWSYANPYTTEGRKNDKGSGTELCDVLVVFGDDVLLFSDKHCAYHSTIDVTVAWKRWYKSAIRKSHLQLQGAHKALRDGVVRVYLEASCQTPLPVALPPSDRARYHLIAVTRGSLEACSRYFNDDSGSYIVHSGIVGEEMHLQNPFHVGRLDASKPFVHVFDELSLEALFAEFTTISDVLVYLRARHDLLCDQAMMVRAVGEEQLVAAFILNEARGNAGFLPRNAGGTRPDFVSFDHTFRPALLEAPEYQRKKLLERKSYWFDRLIERFASTGDPELVPFGLGNRPRDFEEGLRVLASENRFRRRVITQSLADLFRSVAGQPDQRRARVIYSRDDPDLVYVFLVVPQLVGEDDDRYRARRTNMLGTYCACLPLKFANARQFVGIGFDHPSRPDGRGSEDLIVWVPPKLDEEQRRELEEIRRRTGILGDSALIQEFRAREYGGIVVRQGNAQPEPRRRTKQNRDIQKKKRSRKISRQSRKRNR